MARAAAVSQTPFGGALKQASGLHDMSQLTLALEAGVSARHVSFIESGRSQPSRPMVLRLAEALDLMLKGHDPYPALVFIRHWDLVMANMGAANLTQLLNLPAIDGPANLLRLTLHPDMLKPHLEDWEGVARDMVLRARREAEPGVPEDWRDLAMESAKAPFLTVTFNTGGRRLSWITTFTTFGTPHDITLQELRIESFYPADDATENAAAELAESF